MICSFFGKRRKKVEVHVQVPPPQDEKGGMGAEDTLDTLGFSDGSEELTELTEGTSELTSDVSAEESIDLLPIPCNPKFLEALRAMQKTHDRLGAAAAFCRTQEVDVKEVQRMVPPHFVVQKAASCGGMSRIYGGRSQKTGLPVAIKITDVHASLGRYEVHGYMLLGREKIPIPRIYWAGFFNSKKTTTTYLVIVMERLEGTLATLLSVLSADPSQRIRMIHPVIMHLKHLILRLRAANITFGDLSPENVMVQLPRSAKKEDTLRLVVIDPQFAVPTAYLLGARGESGLSEQWAMNFDTVHLALKLHALGMVSSASMRIMVSRINRSLVGSEPTNAQVQQWLVREIPCGLRAIYKIICKNHDEPHDEEGTLQTGHDGSWVMLRRNTV